MPRDDGGRSLLGSFLRRFLGQFNAGCLTHMRAPSKKNSKPRRRDASAKLQPLELTRAAPRIDIFEVGHRAGGMAYVELGRRARLASLIIGVTGGAIGR